MDDDRSWSKDRLVRTGIGAWTTIGVVIVLAGVFWVLGRLSGALAPFIMAGILVLLLRGPVGALERKGIARGLSVAVAYLVVLGSLALLGAFVFPALGAQLSQFLDDFPGYYSEAQQFWVQMQDRFQAIIIPGWIEQALNDVSSAIASQFARWSRSLASGVGSTVGAAASFAFNVVFALVIAFWMLKDLPAMRGEVFDLVGEKRREEAEIILSTVLRVLGGYIKGQALVSLITGVLTAIGLAVLGVPYALVLGLITGVLNVIPYVGAFVGALISAIVAAFVGPWVAVGSVVVTVVAQQVTDLFVTPRVMSEQVDLHPLLVIFSLLAGGTLFGFWGLVAAIPVAAIMKGLFVYYYEKHTQRPLGSEQGALFRKKTVAAEATVAADAAVECGPTSASESEPGTGGTNPPDASPNGSGTNSEERD